MPAFVGAGCVCARERERERVVRGMLARVVEQESDCVRLGVHMTDKESERGRVCVSVC